MTAAEDLLDELCRRIGQAVAVALQGSADERWVDQSQSPLGARLHCAAVRRRRAEGKGGAAVKGRRYLLTRDALTEEMMHSAKPGLRKAVPRGKTEPRPTVAEQTLSRLRLLRTPK